MSVSDNTEGKQRNLIPFKPGQSGNLAGRPKGARSKLGEEFLQAMLADFTEHGVKAIETVRDEKPDQYLKVVASILPKEIEAGENTINVLAELLARIDGRTRTIVPAIVDDRPAVH